MKNKENVANLIAQLKAEIETPYELAAIERLEKELIEGAPKVEVIDENHQKFNGVNFKRQKQGGHYTNTFSIQRAVWMYHFGEIPTGCEIHHRDFNPNNNDIKNLQLLTKIDHRKLHNKTTLIKSFVCENCGQIFETQNTGQNRFCSQKCSADYKKKLAKENIQTFICKECGIEFKANKLRNPQFCSRKCKNRNKSRHREYEERTCKFCGAAFTTRKDTKAQHCSISCARKNYFVNKT